MSPHVREWKSWILDSNPRIPDSSYCIPVFVSGTWILDSNRLWDPDSLSCIPDSKAQDSNSTGKMFPDFGVHKQKFPGFWNPNSLTLGDTWVPPEADGFTLLMKPPLQLQSNHVRSRPLTPLIQTLRSHRKCPFLFFLFFPFHIRTLFTFNPLSPKEWSTPIFQHQHQHMHNQEKMLRVLIEWSQKNILIVYQINSLN